MIMISKTIYYSWDDVSGQVADIARQVIKRKWYPDYIVGITSSGLVPATMLSTFLDVKMHTLDVYEEESNCWMSEDAFGYVDQRKENDTIFDRAKQKKILILDSINQYGTQFSWIKQDWQKTCMPDSPEWDNVFRNNVKFAALTESTNNRFNIDFYSKLTDFSYNTNVIYPWDQWWHKS